MNRTLRYVSLPLVSAFLLVSNLSPAENEITTQQVKYSGLTDIIKKNKGKVIVVDLWGLW
jgi:hypothetical protein